VEVARPDRRLRRQRGKSDPIDAEAAARAVLAGIASVRPKLATGPVEAIRALRIARNGAVKAKTAATNALHALVITAPEPLRSQLRGTSSPKLVRARLRLRPDLDRLDDPTQALKHALRCIARRADALAVESRQLKRQLVVLTKAVAPATTAIFALGPDTASALLVSTGDNPDRLRSEAAFAHLCGAHPRVLGEDERPAPTAPRRRSHRQPCPAHRRRGPVPLLPAHPRLRRRRTADGLSKPEVIRCLKRYLAREVFTALRADYAAIST
jgi:transposase